MDYNFTWGTTTPVEGGHKYAYVQRSEENMEVGESYKREEYHEESKVLPDLDMDIDIQRGEFCNIPETQSLKNLKCDEFEYYNDIVELNIKGQVRKMAKTPKFWSGAHSTLTVMKDIADEKFEIGHKIAIENDVNACYHLHGTQISPEIFTTIPREDGRLDTYMEFIYPGLTLNDVITKHMSMLSNKGLAKEFVDVTTYNLISTVNIMHSNGVSHGDLHAGNILMHIIRKSVNVRFVDFEKALYIYGNENALMDKLKKRDFRKISLVISNLRRACKEVMGDMFTKDDMVNILTTEDAKRLIEETNRNPSIFGRRDQAATVQVLMQSMLERDQQFPGTSKG